MSRLRPYQQRAEIPGPTGISVYERSAVLTALDALRSVRSGASARSLATGVLFFTAGIWLSVGVEREDALPARSTLSDTVVSTTNLDRDLLDSVVVLSVADGVFLGSLKIEPLVHRPGYRLMVMNEATNSVTQLYIPHPIYRCDQGDIDGDGRSEVLLGVVKSARFDPPVKRRLFIYRIHKGHLVPMWLGSRFCGQLQDFRVEPGVGRDNVLTIERDPDAFFAERRYRWDRFGLELDSTLLEQPSNDDIIFPR